MAEQFQIIDQQADFILINKAADCNFHDEQALGEGLFNQVKQQLNLTELYPVHRLDKMTSGLVLMAKNLSAAQQFQQLFEQQQVEKYYLALSDSKPSKKQGLIKGDMAKSRRGRWKLLHSTEHPALTQFFSYAVVNGIRLFVLKPHTGRTHQLRVALASLGAAIIGDPLYHNKAPNTEHGSERGYLHATALSFELHGQHYQYTCLPSQGALFQLPLVQAKINDLLPLSALAWPTLNSPRLLTNSESNL